MKKILNLNIGILILLCPMFFNPSLGNYEKIFRRVKQPSLNWNVNKGILNSCLESLGFTSVEFGDIQDGAVYSLSDGYSLRFAQQGDDKLATVLADNNKPVSVIKFKQNGNPIITMYSSDWQRVIDFISPGQVEVSDSDSLLSMTCKAVPENRNEQIILLHPKDEVGGKEATEKIRTYLESWYGTSVIPSVIIENNAVVRVRQKEDNGDVVDIDSVSLYQNKDGKYYTLLGYYDEDTGSPEFIAYQGRVVFDRVKDSGKPEVGLDKLIAIAKSGGVPSGAVVISEWESHPYRAKLVHEGVTIGAMLATATIIGTTLGLYPANLFVSSALAAGVSFVLYKRLKPAFRYGVNQFAGLFVNMGKLRNLYSPSEEFMANGIQRGGGYWLRYNVFNGNSDAIGMLSSSAYKTLADEPDLDKIANGKLYMSYGSDSIPYQVQLKEILSAWVLSQLFPNIPVVVTTRNQLDTRNFGWKWAGHQWFAGLLSHGKTTPEQYTDPQIWGSYAISPDTKLWSGDPLEAGILAGNTSIAFLQVRQEALMTEKELMERDLSEIKEEMQDQFPAGLQSVDKYNDPEFRGLQVRANNLKEQIGIIDKMIKSIDKVRGGDKAFDWIAAIDTPQIRNMYEIAVREVLGYSQGTSLEDITLLDFLAKNPILTPLEAKKFEETGILVFQNGQVLDPDSIPQLRSNTGGVGK